MCEINQDVTYVSELKGYEEIEKSRILLKDKGYQTWHYTDKKSINKSDLYIVCACPSMPNEPVVLVKGSFKDIDKSKYSYVLTSLDDFPNVVI